MEWWENFVAKFSKKAEVVEQKIETVAPKAQEKSELRKKRDKLLHLHKKWYKIGGYYLELGYGDDLILFDEGMVRTNKDSRESKKMTIQAQADGFPVAKMIYSKTSQYDTREGNGPFGGIIDVKKPMRVEVYERLPGMPLFSSYKAAHEMSLASQKQYDDFINNWLDMQGKYGYDLSKWIPERDGHKSIHRQLFYDKDKGFSFFPLDFSGLKGLFDRFGAFNPADVMNYYAESKSEKEQETHTRILVKTAKAIHNRGVQTRVNNTSINRIAKTSIDIKFLKLAQERIDIFGRELTDKDFDDLIRMRRKIYCRANNIKTSKPSAKAISAKSVVRKNSLSGKWVNDDKMPDNAIGEN